MFLLMKKILVIIVLSLLLTSNAIAKHKETVQMYKEYNYGSNGGDNYKKLDTKLQDSKLSKFVEKQMKNRKKTGLVNYVLFENGKIVIDQNNYNEEIIKNNGLLRSNSMGKSLVAYVVGHGICKGYIDSVNVKLSDWKILNNTLYADNTMLQILNMTAGDHKFVGQRNYGNNPVSSDGSIKGSKKNMIQKNSVAQNMNLYFRGTKKKKENSPYNYSAMTTHVAINYLISKFENAQEYEKFLTEIFRDHVGIKDRVSFQKTSWSSADFNEGNSRFTFFATSHDYLRIGIQIVEDYNSDSCIGDYLRTLYKNRITKNNGYGFKAWQSGAYTKQYGGQFHMSFVGLEDRVIFAMDGRGGQQFVMDMENGRIVLVNSVDQHYDWKKLVLNVIKQK
tara:strand:+ start:49 stop:1221 length:1173 start_codon:yes stop_codon:yes gene_type:complete